MSSRYAERILSGAVTLATNGWFRVQRNPDFDPTMENVRLKVPQTLINKMYGARGLLIIDDITHEPVPKYQIVPTQIGKPAVAVPENP